MNPAGAGKRKRGDRNFSYDSGNNDGSNRPSPHRPGDMGLAQQRNQYGHQGGNHQNGNHHHGNHNQSYQQNQYGGGRGGRRGYNNHRGNGRGGSYAFNNGPGPTNEQGARNGPAGDGEARVEDVETPNTQQMNDTPAVKAPQAREQIETPRSTANSTPAPIAVVAKVPDPPRDIAPYDYQIVTSEVTQDWDASGRDSVRKAALVAYNAGDMVGISAVWQELLRAGLDGRLEAVEAGKTVESILAAAPLEADIDGASLFLDTISVMTDADKSNPRAKFVVTATGIAATLMREELDEPLLQALGLIRPTFGRMFIRKQTHALYRQSNYNLLREETEGYSKLMTELFTTSNDGPPTSEVVEATFENIKALIGAFDLDAGRVLDVTLDVFANLLVKRTAFVVRFLRISSWWPQEQHHTGSGSDVHNLLGPLPAWAQPGQHISEETKELIASLKEQRDKDFWIRARNVGMDAFFELGGRGALSDQDVMDEISAATQVENNVKANTKADAAMKAKELRARETRKWIEATRTLPPPGNPVAAQLLGFKLRFYASQGRSADDNLPQNLIYLAALLIKIGFISLRDLYSHLYPEDESMEEVKAKQMKEKEEREMAKRPGGGALNALARASALPDDTVPMPNSRLKETEAKTATPSKVDPTTSKVGTPAALAEDEEKTEPLPEPVDQKIQLLKSLLCIGAIPEALYIIGRFPWLMDAFTDLPAYIHRIMHHSLSKISDSLTPLSDRDGLRQPAKVATAGPAGSSKGSLKLTDLIPTKSLRWAQMDKNNVDGATDYRFYFDDWADNVPVCQTVDDVLTLCTTFLNLSGVKIGQDTSLLVKLARIGKHSLTQDFSKPNQDRWLDLCKKLLAPALSLTKFNPGVVSEIFEILKFFPTQIRYNIYAEWFTGQTSRLPDVASAFSQTTLETKDVMRRLTKSNMKSMARTLAKISCASPGVVFTAVLNQIESYENLIDVVVECGRYFTYMGYDVLAWSIMSAMGKAGRSRISQDGINTSSWLNALSLFAGKIFKRYSTMNALPLLQYVLQQVTQGNFTDLLVLRELISNMTGVIADTDFTIPQVLAMSGGELLQGMTLRQVHDKRHESKASGKRLMKCITDNDLTGSLLVAIAHARQTCNFNPDQSSLKVIGENVDDIQRVLTQYLDMVQSNLSPTEFSSVIPDIPSLLIDFGLDPSMAFAIHRKGLSRTIEEYDAAHPAEKKERRRSQDELQTLGDVEMQEAQEKTIDELKEVKTDLPAMDDAEDVTVPQSNANVDMVMDAPTPSSTAVESPASPWHPVLETLMQRLKPAFPDGFETRISFPFFVSFWQLSLHDMMAPLSSYDAEIKRQKDRIVAISADRSDVSTAGLRKKDAEKKAINDLLDRLRLEMKAHIQSYSLIRSRLQVEKETWFKDFNKRWEILNDSLLQECFIPRLLISPMDSHFTQKMLFFLHSSGAPGFRTMHLLARLFTDKMLSNLIFMCTAQEADNLGRFLMEILKELHSWHSDKAIYEKKAYGIKKDLPGFAKKLAKDGEAPVMLDYEDFRRLLYKWHLNLLEALKSCLKSSEYMHLKNAIMVSKCVAGYFPAVNYMGAQLNGALTAISKAEDGARPDLCVAANSQLGNLKGMQKKWVMPQAFYHPISTQESTRSASAAPQTEPTTSKQLNATAVPFKPVGSSVNGESRRMTSGKIEVEDGEVEDSKMSDAPVARGEPTSGVVTTEAITKAAAVITQSETYSKIAEPAITPSASLTTREDPVTLSQSDIRSNIGLQESTTRGVGDRSTPVSRLAPDTASGRPGISRQNSAATARGAHSLPIRPETRTDLRGPQRIPPRQHELAGDRVGGGKSYDDGRLERPSETTGDISSNRFHATSAYPEVRPAASNADAVMEDVREIAMSSGSTGEAQQGDRNAPRMPQDLRNTQTQFQNTGNRRPDVGPPQARAQIQPDIRRPPAESQASADGNDANLTPINPKRRGLIEQTHEPTATQHPTRAAEQFPRADDRRSVPSRPHSRERQQQSAHDLRDNGYQDDRSRNYGRPPVEILQRPNGDRASDYASNGPRDGRNMRMGHQSNDPNQFSSSRQSYDRQQIRPPQETSRPARHQDINYGRLNADDEPSIAPSSTAMNSSRGSRDFSGPIPPSDSRQYYGKVSNEFNQRDASYDRSRGPQSNRRDDGPARSEFNPSTPAPVSSAVPAPVDATSLHPSRLQNWDSNERPTPPRLQTGPNSQQQQPRPNDTTSSPASSIPPSGPRSNQQHRSQDNSPINPSGASPTARNPPTGPAVNSDRRRDSRRYNIMADMGQPSAPPHAGPAPPPNPDSSNSQGASIRGIAMAQAGRAAQLQNEAQIPSTQPSTAPYHRRDQASNAYNDNDFSKRNNGPTHPHQGPPPPTFQPQGETALNNRSDHRSTRDGPSRDEPYDRRRDHDPSRARSDRNPSNDHRRDRDAAANHSERDRDREPRDRSHRHHDERRMRDTNDGGGGGVGHRERPSGRGGPLRDEYPGREERYPPPPNAQMPQQAQAQAQAQAPPPRREPLPPQEIMAAGRSSGSGGAYYGGDKGGGDRRGGLGVVGGGPGGGGGGGDLRGGGGREQQQGRDGRKRGYPGAGEGGGGGDDSMGGPGGVGGGGYGMMGENKRRRNGP